MSKEETVADEQAETAVATNPVDPEPTFEPDGEPDGTAPEPEPEADVEDGIDMDRIAALERALGATVGINVNDFNPREIQAAREKAKADAAAKAAAILAEAEKFEVVLTPKQRLERLERAARSAGVAI